MKLVKYIKQNADNDRVKSRWLGKHFPVPAERLPDYDVDISDYKPPATKKSKRKYENPLQILLKTWR